MIKELIRTFHTPSIQTIIQEELEESTRELLKAESGLEYAKAMVEYRQAQVIRLTQLANTRRN